jgi:hypothetical protein
MARLVTGVALGVLGFLLAAELLFRLLPVGTATLTGYHIDPAILNYPPRHTWRSATGWDLRNAQSLRSNNLGFASERDFVPDPRAVALVGDSYVEASMLPADKRPGPQLERLLGRDRPVYALGGPGSSLLDYAERIRFAHQRLKVRNFVLLLEPGDVRQALCGSGNVHSACLDRATLAPWTQKQADPSPLKRALRHSALAQYLVGQLRVDPGKLLRDAFRRSVPDNVREPPVGRESPSGLTPTAAQRIDTASKTFFDRVAPYVDSGNLVIVIDGQRSRTAPLEHELALERARFIDNARTAGAKVVDVEPSYEEHARRSRLSLSIGPYDGHLNALGVGIVMAAAARALE